MNEVHPNERMFKCDVCSYESNYMQNIKTHMATHHEEALYICDICGFKHKWKVSYLAHRRQAHNIILRKEKGRKRDDPIEKKKLLCVLCGYVPETSKNLKKHNCDKSTECKSNSSPSSDRIL